MTIVALGHRRARRRVARHVHRLELFAVATPTALATRRALLPTGTATTTGAATGATTGTAGNRRTAAGAGIHHRDRRRDADHQHHRGDRSTGTAGAATGGRGTASTQARGRRDRLARTRQRRAGRRRDRLAGRRQGRAGRRRGSAVRCRSAGFGSGTVAGARGRSLRALAAGACGAGAAGQALAGQVQAPAAQVLLPERRAPERPAAAEQEPLQRGPTASAPRGGPVPRAARRGEARGVRSSAWRDDLLRGRFRRGSRLLGCARRRCCGFRRLLDGCRGLGDGRRRGRFGRGRLRLGRLLGGLLGPLLRRLLGLLVADQALALGLAADAVGLGSSIEDEWLFTPMPSATQRSRLSLLVSPSSFASS